MKLKSIFTLRNVEKIPALKGEVLKGVIIENTSWQFPLHKLFKIKCLLSHEQFMWYRFSGTMHLSC